MKAINNRSTDVNLSTIISRLILNLYLLLPKNTVNYLGSLAILRKVRDKFLRNKQGFKESTVTIKKEYFEYTLEFKYTSSIRNAAKAKKKGVETKLLLNSLKLAKQKPAFTVFDIGSNFGYLSLVWSQTLAKEGKVFSFEPNGQVYNCFNNSIKSNGFTNLVTENMAVGSQSGKTNIYINNATSNILSTEANGFVKKVDIVAIDDYFAQKSLTRCDLIKIDVDGYEYEVLKGAKQTINKFKPLIIIETNKNHEIIDFMRGLNYKIYDSDLKDDFTEIPENVFCVYE